MRGWCKSSLQLWIEMDQPLLVFGLTLGYCALVSSLLSVSSETRAVLSLDGSWNCYCVRESDPVNGLRKVAVPGSLNDFNVQMDPRGCQSDIWCHRVFFLPGNLWKDNKVWLNLDDVSASTGLWINGQHVASVNATYLPTEYEVTDMLNFDKENYVTFTLARGLLTREPLGLPQSVSLIAVPAMLWIQNVTVNTTLLNGTASVAYEIVPGGWLQLPRTCISVQAFDMDHTLVSGDRKCGFLEGTVLMPSCKLWWPMGMDAQPGHLYTLVFELYCKDNREMRDVYRQRIGIRTLSWTGSLLMVNGKRLYLQGAEASEAWARTPFDPRVNVKDGVLLKWLYANTLSTKLAPADEVLSLADELGLLVIVGVAANVFKDVVARCKDHPSVVMWSLPVDAPLIDEVKALDSTRPLTTVVPLQSNESTPTLSEFDIVSVGLENVPWGRSFFTEASTLVQEAFHRLQKPLIVMYGDKVLPADNRIRTLTYDPLAQFGSCQKGFGILKGNASVVGEFFGNFVAYEQFSDNSLRLVDGIFNRNREPTVFADIVRKKFKKGRSSSQHKKGK